MELLQLFVTDAIFAAIAGLGFAMVFNVPLSTLWAAVMAAALGHGTRELLKVGLDMNLPAASLAGAVVAGFWAVWCSRRFGRPAQIFSIPGVIPMIPGKFAYLTMIGLVHIAIKKEVPPAELQETLQKLLKNIMCRILKLHA